MCYEQHAFYGSWYGAYSYGKYITQPPCKDLFRRFHVGYLQAKPAPHGPVRIHALCPKGTLSEAAQCESLVQFSDYQLGA